jgi:DNA-binding response OmpR family regulator
MRDSPSDPVVLLLQGAEDCAMYAEFFRHHGIVPDCAVHVVDALACAPSADVIVTELMVPTVTAGRAFIQTLRIYPPTQRTPIIVVTSWAWHTERLLARDAGCDLFLTKPCLPTELLREVRRVLAAHYDSSGSPSLPAAPSGPSS